MRQEEEKVRTHWKRNGSAFSLDSAQEGEAGDASLGACGRRVRQLKRDMGGGGVFWGGGCGGWGGGWGGGGGGRGGGVWVFFYAPNDVRGLPTKVRLERKEGKLGRSRRQKEGNEREKNQVSRLRRQRKNSVLIREREEKEQKDHPNARPNEEKGS